MYDQEYVKYLAVSQTNYTQEYLGGFHKKISHDQINRYMRRERIRPRDVWDAVKQDIEQDEDGILVFDDTVLDKGYSRKIELVNRQYSGLAKATIPGIGVVTCIYVNPKTRQFWVIDFRIYEPLADGKTKHQHVQDMITHAVEHKKLSFRHVTFDGWYTSLETMKHIASHRKLFY